MTAQLCTSGVAPSSPLKTEDATPPPATATRKPQEAQPTSLLHPDPRPARLLALLLTGLALLVAAEAWSLAARLLGYHP